MEMVMKSFEKFWDGVTNAAHEIDPSVKISELDKLKAFASFYSGCLTGREDGIAVGYEQGYKQAMKDAKEDFLDILDEVIRAETVE